MDDRRTRPPASGQPPDALEIDLLPRYELVVYAPGAGAGAGKRLGAVQLDAATASWDQVPPRGTGRPSAPSVASASLRRSDLVGYGHGREG